jgi:hypothetical protein
MTKKFVARTLAEYLAGNSAPEWLPRGPSKAFAGKPPTRDRKAWAKAYAANQDWANQQWALAAKAGQQ